MLSRSSIRSPHHTSPQDLLEHYLVRIASQPTCSPSDHSVLTSDDLSSRQSRILLRRHLRTYLNNREVREFNACDSSRSLHALHFNPIRWRHWFSIFDRPSVTMLSRFLSGHWPTRYFLKRIRVCSIQTCRFCSYHTESRDHLVFHCPYFAEARSSCLPSSFTSLSALVSSHQNRKFLSCFLHFVFEAFDCFPPDSL